jgi:hypothetical protein
MINGRAATMELMNQPQTCAEIIIWKPCMALLHRTAVPLNINTNKTALQIFIGPKWLLKQALVNASNQH